MTNVDGGNTSVDATKDDDRTTEKEKCKEETPVIEPVINLLQQLEDYSPTV